MPVNLRGLPDELDLPAQPSRLRWLSIILLCSLAGSAIALLFWPGEMQPRSLWFWCCVLVFPVAGAFFLFGLRRLAYENRQAYVDSWNSARSDLESHLIGEGQLRTGLLACAYCTPAGSNKLAEALRKGSKPLAPVYQPSLRAPINISVLTAQKPQEQAPDYSRRLEAYLDRVLAVLVPDLQRMVPGRTMRVRIRHNQVLSDVDVLAVWEACAQRKALIIESASTVTQEDGLMWLDSWLDNPKEFPLVLSVELNLFDRPVADQAESVSALLFAHQDYCSQQRVEPIAWVHRPLEMSDDPQSAKEVLLWGQVSSDSEPFAWQAHVNAARLNVLKGALLDQGCSLSPTACLHLDDSLGAPGCAVGNIAVIVGSEQAAADHQPQLLMLQDATPHWCVVRPVQQPDPQETL